VTWLSWRLQRFEALLATLMLVAVAAALVPIGLHIASVYRAGDLGACVGVQRGGCSSAVAAFTNRFEQLGGLFGWFNLLPGLLGVMLAIPFVVDFEQGTFRLAWTQSVTRRRWLTTRLATIVVAGLLGTAALVALFTWWRSPFDQLRGRMDPDGFDFEGTVAFAYTLFAAGLVLAIGVVVRRAAATFAAAFIGWLVVRLAIQNGLRSHYLPAVRKIWPASSSGPDLSRAWVLNQQPVNSHGQPIANLLALLRSCSRPTADPGLQFGQACARHKGVFNEALYQPASRFWAFQGIETAIFAALAISLFAFAAWWVMRRAA
jgi:hypothetical protein